MIPNEICYFDNSVELNIGIFDPEIQGYYYREGGIPEYQKYESLTWNNTNIEPYRKFIETGQPFLFFIYVRHILASESNIKDMVLPLDLQKAVLKKQCQIVLENTGEFNHIQYAADRIIEFCKKNRISRLVISCQFNQEELSSFSEEFKQQGITVNVIDNRNYEVLSEYIFGSIKSQGFRNYVSIHNNDNSRLYQDFSRIFLVPANRVTDGRLYFWEAIKNDENLRYSCYTSFRNVNYMDEIGWRENQFNNSKSEVLRFYLKTGMKNLYEDLQKKTVDDCMEELDLYSDEKFRSGITYQEDTLVPYYNSTLIDIVHETGTESKFLSSVTEKTYKSIVLCRPFIVVGSPGVISHLHRKGYLTFDRWFDESYDSEKDPAIRYKIVLENMVKISKMSKQELQKIMCEMRDVLLHNYRQYYVISGNTTLLYLDYLTEQKRLKNLKLNLV